MSGFTGCPPRWFNMVVTGLSAVSAVFVSVLTPGGILHGPLGFGNPVTGWLAGIDLGQAGLHLVGLFLLIWAVARLVHRRRTSLEIPRVSE